MSIKPDKWITRMVKECGMIEPYVDSQVKANAVSFGVSSYGYDIRIADEFKIFTNINSTVVNSGPWSVRIARGAPRKRTA
jgi:dCTP deaminase